MARLTTVRLPVATEEYTELQFNMLVRELEQIITQLNFSYQQNLKEEVNTRNWYLG